MNKVRVQDDDIMGSNSGSDLDLSALNENETDDFGRRILQHQREAQAAKKENRTPFWRAKPRPRTTIPIETLAITEAVAKTHQRTASEGSVRSDPPLNVPLEWGRRAKRRSDWSRRHESDGEQKEGGSDGGKADGDAIFPHKTLYTGDENPMLSSGGVLASIEDTPPSMRRKRQMSSPSSLHHMNTTLQPALDNEDEDSNDASLLVSKPAVNHRNRKIDDLMKREIETLEKQAVTRRTLGRLAGQTENRPGSAPSGDVNRVPRRRRSNLSDKENEPAGEDLIPPEQPFRNARKSSHGRADSINLLRKLARVSSLSPSPGKDKLEAEAERRKSDAGKESGAFAAKGANGDYGATSKPTASKDPAEPRRVRIHDEAVKRVSEKQEKEDDLQKTPKASRGWFGFSAERQEKSQTLRDPRRILSEPSQPKSALEEIVQEARARGDPQIGDATLASLENIVNPNTDATSSELNFDDQTSKQTSKSDDMRRPLTQAEKDRRQEDLALAALNKRLSSTRTTIKDANRGLRRLENRIEAAGETGTDEHEIIVPGETERPHWPREFTPYVDHNSRTICEHCGGSYRSVWSGLWTEFRELFWTWEGSSLPTEKDKLKFRLTWIGWGIIAWWTWYFLECLAYEYFGRKYNTYFPFVIPTVLGSPFEPIWRPLFDILAVLWKWCFGEVKQRPPTRPKPPLPPGYVRPGGAVAPAASAASVKSAAGGGWNWANAAKATAKATRRIVGSAKQAVDDVGSMWDDEVL